MAARGVPHPILSIALLVTLSPVLMAGQTAPAPRARSSSEATNSASALALQVFLDRAGFSPGEIDGELGANTRRAMDAFRKARRLPAGDEPALLGALNADGVDPLTTYLITAEDAAGPFVAEIPLEPKAQAALPGLFYTSVLELVGERVHASPKLLRTLNPGAAFAAGDSVRVPNVTRTKAPSGPVAPNTPAPSASRIVVSRSNSGLTAYDGTGRPMFFAPVTSGSQHDPLPLGKWTVTAVARNPTFNYNPALFWDAEPGDEETRLPAGPNGPVGTIWIDISKPHYGIHGTSEPGQVGHVTSHGCVRLTNWDAETVAGLVRKGTAVLFER